MSNKSTFEINLNLLSVHTWLLFIFALDWEIWQPFPKTIKFIPPWLNFPSIHRTLRNQDLLSLLYMWRTQMPSLNRSRPLESSVRGTLSRCRRGKSSSVKWPRLKPPIVIVPSTTSQWRMRSNFPRAIKRKQVERYLQVSTQPTKRVILKSMHSSMSWIRNSIFIISLPCKRW